MPGSVLTALIASAPPSAIAFAMPRTSVAAGETLTIKGRSVARRTAAVTSPAAVTVVGLVDPVDAATETDEAEVELWLEIPRALDSGDIAATTANSGE